MTGKMLKILGFMLKNICDYDIFFTEGGSDYISCTGFHL